MSFDEYVVKWKIHCRVKTSLSWAVGQDQVLRDHISPYLSHHDIKNISSEHISVVIQESKIKGHKRNTTRKVYLLLSKLFNDAVHFFELIDKSPVKKRYHAISAEKVKQPFLHPNDAWVFLEYVMHDIAFGPAVWLQTLSGLRVCEVQALDWRDVDFKANVIHVRRIYKRTIKKIDTGTKNGDPHTVPMTPPLRNYLIIFKKKSGFVVMNQSGGMMSYYSYRTFISRTVRKLNSPIRSSHHFRHTFTEIWIDAGASLEHCRRMLNHKSHQAIMNYVHFNDQTLRDIALKVTAK